MISGLGWKVCGSLAVIGVFAGCASGDSLCGEGSFFTSLLSDQRAAKVGDVIQIIITESASATHTADRTNSVSNQSSLGPGTGKLGFLPLFGYSGASDSSSKGEASRTETFVGRVAVTVKSITPTGNLVVEGERTIQVNKDLQKMTLTGEVRPRDIASDNTIPSSAVANARIEYEGSDPQKPGSKVGFITGMLHWLF